MSYEYKKCDYCGGQGTVVDHGQSRISGQQIGGSGLLKCPRCHGSGQTNILKKDNDSHDSSSFEGLNTFAFILTWGVLFYFTYRLDTVLLEMLFGKDVNLSEFVKWTNFIIILIPPTVIVYLFRKIIPALFAIAFLLAFLAIVFVILSKLLG